MAIGKKTVDTVAKVDKISEEHLKELQQLVNAINAMQYNIGKIETQKHNILHDFAEGQDRIKLMQDKMKKEYGTYDINVTDGTINWPEEPRDESADRNE